MFAPEPPPVDVAARNGPMGTAADIAPGYVLYARSGALAQVIDVLRGVEEHGRVRSGLIYAQGMHGASDELWIPIEAVSAVYPETRSAFLAIKGDEPKPSAGTAHPPALAASLALSRNGCTNSEVCCSAHHQERPSQAQDDELADAAPPVVLSLRRISFRARRRN